MLFSIGDITTITFIFIFGPLGLVLFCWIFSCCSCCCYRDETWTANMGNSSKAFSIVLFVVVTVFGLLYMDWVLGAIAGNYSGLPSRDNAILYWTYFGVKRLGFLAV